MHREERGPLRLLGIQLSGVAWPQGAIALGLEAFRLMSIECPEDAASQFPDSLLRDLAGNAFDGAVFLATFTTMVVALSECSWRRSEIGNPSSTLGEVAEAVPHLGRGISHCWTIARTPSSTSSSAPSTSQKTSTFAMGRGISECWDAAADDEDI